MENKPAVIFARPRRVLVADEPGSCQRMVDWFVAHNFVATGRENGVDALSAFREGFYDLVITDLILPGLSGMQLLQTIKEINPRVPVIMMSGYGHVETVVEALKLGAENYLIKPLNDDELAKVVEQALAISKSHLDSHLFEGKANQITTLDCPSRSELIAEVVFMAAQSAMAMNYVEHDLDNNIKLAMVEAITNAMEHGHKWDADKSVLIIIDVTSSRFRLVVQDKGPGFDHGHDQDPTSPENLLLERGRGVFLMRAIMDEVHYSDGGRRVEIIKYASDKPPRQE